MLRLEYPIGIRTFEDLAEEWYIDATGDDILLATRDDGTSGKSAIILSKSPRGDALISHFCLKHMPNPAIKLSGKHHVTE